MHPNLKKTIEYHEATKHHYDRYARSLGHMDWANQPHPFRIYEGAERMALSRELRNTELPYETLYLGGQPGAPLNLDSISAFFRQSLALSAWKEYGDSRWALRVNPSSGNLHPTEAYLLWQDALYHYQPEDHSLERRADLSTLTLPSGFFVVLTSVVWRETWKYGERSFRYCQHDMGHALAALSFSASLLGWALQGIAWDSHSLSRLLGLDRAEFLPQEMESAEALVWVGAGDPPVLSPEKILPALSSATWHGKPNRLSAEYIQWEILPEVIQATEADRSPVPEVFPTASPSFPFPKKKAVETIQQRRSAVAFDGTSEISSEIFYSFMGRVLPTPTAPWNAGMGRTAVNLLLFVHRVKGVASGIYFLDRSLAMDRWREKMRPEFLWTKQVGTPGDLPLYLLMEGDVREGAVSVSCHQAIAGDSFFSLGMVADYRATLNNQGPSAYRRLFWECGMIGQVLYLEAEAQGARATGIGCYFDDPVHRLMGIDGDVFQDLYHFTVGLPVEDRRLITHAPYEKLTT